MTTELTLLPRVAWRGQEITSGRLRSLLALLAGDLRTGASAARLVEGLWPEEQPEHPAKALQVVVSRARAQLGAGVIASTPTGYRLALAAEQVDTSAVLLSASASARCSRAGDHAAALAHAEAGLALWEGAAGGDAELDDPLAALRAERAAAYPTLVRSRALALARLGRHAEAAEPLAELAAERPRDEEVLGELLRGEAATVGPSAALARYEAYAARCGRSSAPTPAPTSRRCTGSCCRAARRRSGAGCRTSPTRCWAATTTSPPWPACCAPPGSPRSWAPAAWARPGSPRW